MNEHSGTVFIMKSKMSLLWGTRRSTGEDGKYSKFLPSVAVFNCHLTSVLFTFDIIIISLCFCLKIFEFVLYFYFESLFSYPSGVCNTWQWSDLWPLPFSPAALWRTQLRWINRYSAQFSVYRSLIEFKSNGFIYSYFPFRFSELLKNTNRKQHDCQHYHIHCGLFAESTGNLLSAMLVLLTTIQVVHLWILNNQVKIERLLLHIQFSTNLIMPHYINIDMSTLYFRSQSLTFTGTTRERMW